MPHCQHGLDYNVVPRGRRPSTAALTRLGARKASEMAILTCRTLQFSRVQSSATVVIRPETTSSSHRRPRAIALTRRARRSNCSGRTLLRDALCGSRIWRDLLDGGFCQGLFLANRKLRHRELLLESSMRLYPNKANGSILRRLIRMSYWFGAPIPWFSSGRTRSRHADGIERGM